MTMFLPETYFLQLALRKGTTLHLNGAFFTMSWKCVIVNGDASPTITRTIYFTLVKDGRTLFRPDGTQRIVTMEESKYVPLFHTEFPCSTRGVCSSRGTRFLCERKVPAFNVASTFMNNLYKSYLFRSFAFDAERNGEFQSEKNCSLKRCSYLFADLQEERCSRYPIRVLYTSFLLVYREV